MSTDEGDGAAGEDRDFVQSLERGLAVIRAFSGEHPRMTLSDAARQADLTRATARRVLHTLRVLGYVTSDGRTFELTPKVLDLGYAYLSSFQVGEIAQQAMEQLSAAVHESVSAAVLDGTEIVYVARVPTARIMRIGLSIGSRLPAYATSMGRVLLASLPEDVARAVLDRSALEPLTSNTVTDPDELLRVIAQVRSQGYCIVDEELEDGVRSIAAPLCDRRGRVVAALNVGTQVGRVTKQQLVKELLPQLLSTAQAISGQLAKQGT
jgi:IclR family transcriptional regulator, pca regulon regulatory protein